MGIDMRNWFASLLRHLLGGKPGWQLLEDCAPIKPGPFGWWPDMNAKFDSPGDHGARLQCGSFLAGIVATPLLSSLSNSATSVS